MFQNNDNKDKTEDASSNNNKEDNKEQAGSNENKTNEIISEETVSNVLLKDRIRRKCTSSEDEKKNENTDTVNSKSTPEQNNPSNPESSHPKVEKGNIGDKFNISHFSTETENITELKRILRDIFEYERTLCLNKIAKIENREQFENHLDTCLQNIWEQTKKNVNQMKLVSTEKHLESDSNNKKKTRNNKNISSFVAKRSGLAENLQISCQNKSLLNSTKNNVKRFQSDKLISIDGVDMRQKVESETEKTMFKTITIEKDDKNENIVDYGVYQDKKGHRYAFIYDPEVTTEIKIIYYSVRSLLYFPVILYSKNLMRYYSKLVFMDNEKKKEIQELQEKSVFENFIDIQNLLNSKLSIIMKAISNTFEKYKSISKIIES